MDNHPGFLQIYADGVPEQLTRAKMTAMDRVGFRSGIELFNQAEFFEAHEALEEVWRAAPAGEKMFLQGLIQVADHINWVLKADR